MSNLISTSVENGVMTIRMQRPEKKNALNVEMYRAMTGALEEAKTNAGVRAVLITGGEANFSSGNDIGDFLNGPEWDLDHPVLHFLHTLAAAEKPLVAAVNGVAVGIGTTMLLHCDLVYVGEDARFRLPFVNLGLVPEAGSSLLLPLMAGHQRAAELLMLGDMFDAATAHSVGIVTRVLPDNQVQATGLAKAQMLATKPQEALRMTKELMKRNHNDTLRAVMAIESRLFAERLQSDEARAAFQAFLAR